MFRTLVALGLVSLISLPLGAQAQGLAGPYLAARQAVIENDFEKSAEYAARALLRDRENPRLMETTMLGYVAAGRVGSALRAARTMQETDQPSQLSALVVFAAAAQDEDWDKILTELDAGTTAGSLFDGLIRGWAHAGKGDVDSALTEINAVASGTGLLAFGEYHSALVLAQSGDLEGAAAILDGDENGQVNLTRHGNKLYFQILSQLGRNEDALAHLVEVFGEDTAKDLEGLRSTLETGGTLPLTGITSARAGVAEVFFSIAGVVLEEADPTYTLQYARFAHYLDPGHVESVMMAANLLEQLQQYDLATEAYRAVPRSDPSYYAAELGRAEALRRAGESDAAIDALSGLSEAFPDVALVHVNLADNLRRVGRFQESSESYDRAIALLGEEQPAHWIVYFARGITHEREGRWVQAEDDMRRALRLNPDQPSVLNYMGYSFVEMGENLDEALDMIERAAAAEPDSGHIIDSLGWVLYRLGQYEEAVEPMERAARLMPTDPTVNDHLGDVYWAVGRKLEAEFQWKRALSFADPDDIDADYDPDRMRRKLEVGLDAVLEEEGAPPLAVASDDG